MMAIPSAPDAATALFRQYDRDRYLAHLFLPAPRRGAVAALHAFSLELARVRELVHEPMAGEIRLGWWRELLQGNARGDASGHPVAASLLQAIDAHSISRAPLVAMTEARSFDLYNDPMPDLNALEGYLGETVSVLFQLACHILDPAAAVEAADASGHAGVAFGLAGLQRALPLHTARGQCFVPLDVLARHGASADDLRTRRNTPALRGAIAEMREHARHHIARAQAAKAKLPAVLQPAFLSLALLPAYLKAVESNSEPLSRVADISPWRAPWLLWRASRS